MGRAFASPKLERFVQDLATEIENSGIWKYPYSHTDHFTDLRAVVQEALGGINIYAPLEGEGVTLTEDQERAMLFEMVSDGVPTGAHFASYVQGYAAAMLDVRAAQTVSPQPLSLQEFRDRTQAEGA